MVSDAISDFTNQMGIMKDLVTITVIYIRYDLGCERICKIFPNRHFVSEADKRGGGVHIVGYPRSFVLTFKSKRKSERPWVSDDGMSTTKTLFILLSRSRSTRLS